MLFRRAKAGQFWGGGPGGRRGLCPPPRRRDGRRGPCYADLTDTVRELGWPGGPATAVFHRYYDTASGRTTCTTAERGQGQAAVWVRLVQPAVSMVASIARMSS